MPNLGQKEPYLGCYLFPEHSGEGFVYVVNAIGKTALIVQPTCKVLCNGSFIPVKGAEEKILAMDEVDKKYAVMSILEVAEKIPWDELRGQD